MTAGCVNIRRWVTYNNREGRNGDKFRRLSPDVGKRGSADSVAEPAARQLDCYVRMSRSRKKTPVGSILVCGRTEKEDKRIWHQKLRSRDRRRLNDLVRKHVRGEVEELFGNFLATLPEDVSAPWFMRKEWRVRRTRDRFDTELEYLRWISK